MMMMRSMFLEFGSGHSSGDIEEVTTRRPSVVKTLDIAGKAKDFVAEKTHLPSAVKFFIILLVILAIAGCIFCILRFMKKRRSVNNSPKGMNGVDMKSVKLFESVYDNKIIFQYIFRLNLSWRSSLMSMNNARIIKLSEFLSGIN